AGRPPAARFARPRSHDRHDAHRHDEVARAAVGGPLLPDARGADTVSCGRREFDLLRREASDHRQRRRERRRRAFRGARGTDRGEAMHVQKRFLLAGVMGWPIAHSRSPKIHNYWLKLHGLEGFYAPLAIEPGKLGAALRALGPLGFSGCNLTIPHKEAAMKLVDGLDPGAARIGAINCVVVEADGSLTGRNYDGFGFTASLRAAAPRWRADAAPAV